MHRDTPALEHRFCMARGHYKGPAGFARSVFWAAIANNLVAISTSAG